MPPPSHTGSVATVEILSRLTLNHLYRCLSLVEPHQILAKAKKAVGRTHDLQGVFTFALQDTATGQRLQVHERANALQDERDLQGVYLLRTTVADLPADDWWRTYMLLTRVEAAFRNLKTDLCIRPIYPHKETRGNAHVLFAVLAYALSVTLQLRHRQRGGLTTAAFLETLQPQGLAERSDHTTEDIRPNGAWSSVTTAPLRIGKSPTRSSAGCARRVPAEVLFRRSRDRNDAGIQRERVVRMDLKEQTGVGPANLDAGAALFDLRRDVGCDPEPF